MQDSLSQKVSFGEKIGYSLGDAAANLVFQMMMIFQLKFYTDVFGLDGKSALRNGAYGLRWTYVRRGAGT